MLPRLRLSAEPLTKSERRRGAFWASVMVFGTTAFMLAAVRWMPDWVMHYTPVPLLELLLYPGEFVALIVYELASHISSSESVIDWIAAGFFLGVNWCFYFFVFSNWIHLRNRAKLQRTVQTN